MSIRAFIAYVLIAIGMLTVLLSGACSLAIIGPSLLSGKFNSSNFAIVALIGGVPFVSGLFLAFIGFILRPRNIEFDQRKTTAGADR